MMRVRMLKTAAGPDGVMAEGSEQQVSGDLGRALIESAAAVALERVRETAAVEPPPERAVPEAPKPKARPRRRAAR